MNTNPLVLNNGVPATEPLTGAASVASSAIFSYQQPSGTGGGNATGGVWNTEPLNITEDTQPWAALASNQITLTAGTYYFDITSPSWSTDHYQTRLQNITNNLTALVGSSEYSASPASDAATNSFIKGIVTINSTTTFEVQLLPGHTSASYGLGLPSSTPSTNEVYCRVIITQYTAGATPGALTYAQAYFGSSSGWSTSSPSYVDPTNAGGNALTVRESSGLVLTPAASNVCGITFTPSSPESVYIITATFPLFNTLTDATSVAKLTDGTLDISTAMMNNTNTGNDVLTPATLSGIYVPGVNTPVTVRLQLAAVAGSGTAHINNIGATTLANAVEWTVVQLNNINVMSNDGIVFAAGLSGTVAVPGSGAVPVLYDTVLGDNTNSYNPVTGIYTIPADGWYDISAQDSVSSGGTRDNWTIALYKNGTQIASNIQATFAAPTIGSIQTPSINIKQPFKKGDQLQIQLFNQNGNSKSWGSGVIYDFFCIASITTTSTNSNIVKSPSTGAFSFSNTRIPVTDPSGNPLTCSITTNGGDVEVGLQGDGTDQGSSSGTVISDSTPTDSFTIVYFYRDGNLIAAQSQYMQNNIAIEIHGVPASAYKYIDSPPPGNHVYTVQIVGGVNRGDQQISYAVLYAKPSGGIGGGTGSGAAAYWSGYFINGAEWSVANTAFSDFALVNGTATLVQRKANNLQVSAAAGSLPGISFIVPNSNAAYMISATFDGIADGQFNEYQLTDGTTEISNGTRANTAGTFEQLKISGIYAPGSSGLVTVKLMGASQPTGTATINTDNTGDATLVSAIEWSIVQLPSSGGPSAWTPYTPIFTGMGSVSSQTFWYKFDGADSILIKGTWTPPTPDASVASVSLPLGYNTNAAKVNPTAELVGYMTENNSNAVAFTVVIAPSSPVLNFSYNSNTDPNGGLSTVEAGTTIFSGGNTYSFVTSPVPIS